MYVGLDCVLRVAHYSHFLDGRVQQVLIPHGRYDCTHGKPAAYHEEGEEQPGKYGSGSLAIYALGESICSVRESSYVSPLKICAFLLNNGELEAFMTNLGRFVGARY